MRALGQITGTRRGVVSGAAATVLLATGSTLAVAGTSGALSAAGGSRAAACATPALGGTVVQVTELDMGMSSSMMGSRVATMRLVASPRRVPTGIVSLLVRNQGTRTHELVILPLAWRQVAGSRRVGGDGRVQEAGSLGEASRTCGAGAGGGIARARTGWVTLRLATGRYELVCNIKNHYSDGMFTELDVA